MIVTKTLVSLRNNNYLAVERIPGQFEPVVASGPTREAAIAACVVKKEARESAKQRRDEIAVSLLCAHQCCS